MVYFYFILGGGNSVLMKLFERYSKSINNSFTRELFWQRCQDHCLHRAALGKEFYILDYIDEIKNNVDKIKYTYNYINRASQKKKTLEK